MPNCTDEPRNDREITEFCKFWIEVIYFFNGNINVTSREVPLKSKQKKYMEKVLSSMTKHVLRVLGSFCNFNLLFREYLGSYCCNNLLCRELL